MSDDDKQPWLPFDHDDMSPEEISKPVKDGRGHSPGSFSTRIKKGEKRSPGRPKGSRNMRTLMNEAFTLPVEWKDGGKTRKVPMVVPMLNAWMKRSMAGEYRYLDSVLNVMYYLSNNEQRELYDAESKERHKIWKENLALYSLQDQDIFGMEPEDLAKVREVAELLRRKPMGYETLVERLMEKWGIQKKRR